MFTPSLVFLNNITYNDLQLESLRNTGQEVLEDFLFRPQKQPWVENGNFEGLRTWTTNGVFGAFTVFPTYEWETTIKDTGSRSLQINWTADNASAQFATYGGLVGNDQAPFYSEGKNARFRCRVWVPSGSPDVELVIPFYTRLSGSHTTSAKDRWVDLDFEFLPQAGTQAFPGIQIAATATGGICYVDNFRIEQRVFFDDFTGSAGAVPNTAYWTRIDGGGAGIDGGSQYYRPENATLDGSGNLKLELKAESHNGYSYTSGRVESEDKVHADYGRIEARIQLPAGGQGLWPAFWMMGDEEDNGLWPRNGEIDILESINSMDTIYSVIHGPIFNNENNPNQWQDDEWYVPTGTAITGFHEYALEWEPDRLHFYFDNVKYATIERRDMATANKWAFNANHAYMILNVAFGGAWAGAPNGTAVLPQTMLVDWVRQWSYEGPYVGAHPFAEALVSDFADDREFDLGTGITISGGKLSITPTTSYHNAASQRRFNVWESSVFAELVTPPNVGNGSTEATLQVLLPVSGRKANIGWANGNLVMKETISTGSETSTSLAYDAVNHKFQRLRVDPINADLLFETSPSGTTWTLRRTVDLSAVSETITDELKSARVLLIAGYWNTEPSPGVAEWQSINSAETVILGGFVGWGVPI